ncbi:hypothetical protein EVAR_27767_1 [Eumeta japonica]|uniref:Uncharacterized protein n=1 Tax=Eumeta variegata TaxID=151549 RepID=A0A4C1VAU8_EUMVA|nr:hypothetical protein EVAR_27767_1 [Eumeta japonica]
MQDASLTGEGTRERPRAPGAARATAGQTNLKITPAPAAPPLLRRSLGSGKQNIYVIKSDKRSHKVEYPSWWGRDINLNRAIKGQRRDVFTGPHCGALKRRCINFRVKLDSFNFHGKMDRKAEAQVAITHMNTCIIATRGGTTVAIQLVQVGDKVSVEKAA